MKNLLVALIVLLFFSGNVFSESDPEVLTKLQFIETFDFEKNTIYDLSLDYLAETFNDSKSAIEIQDKSRGKIIGRGINQRCFDVGYGIGFRSCKFTIIIEFKGNRVRTTYDNIKQLGTDGKSYPMNNGANNQVMQAKKNITKMQSDFVAYINGKKNANW